MTTTIKNGSCFTVRHYMRSLKPVNIFFCVSARARAGTGGHQGTRRWAGRLHRGTNDRRRRGSRRERLSRVWTDLCRSAVRSRGGCARVPCGPRPGAWPPASEATAEARHVRAHPSACAHTYACVPVQPEPILTTTRGARSGAGRPAPPTKKQTLRRVGGSALFEHNHFAF